jgi:hypothetical protein
MPRQVESPRSAMAAAFSAQGFQTTVDAASSRPTREHANQQIPRQILLPEPLTWAAGMPAGSSFKPLPACSSPTGTPERAFGRIPRPRRFGR